MLTSWIFFENKSRDQMTRTLQELCVICPGLQAVLRRIYTDCDDDMVRSLLHVFPHAKILTTFYNVRKVISVLFYEVDILKKIGKLKSYKKCR